MSAITLREITYAELIDEAMTQESGPWAVLLGADGDPSMEYQRNQLIRVADHPDLRHSIQYATMQLSEAENEWLMTMAVLFTPVVILLKHGEQEAMIGGVLGDNVVQKALREFASTGRQEAVAERVRDWVQSHGPLFPAAGAPQE